MDFNTIINNIGDLFDFSPDLLDQTRNCYNQSINHVSFARELNNWSIDGKPTHVYLLVACLFRAQKERGQKLTLISLINAFHSTTGIPMDQYEAGRALVRLSFLERVS
ncbi:MAG: hypothetical protein ACFFCS_21600 [Candidatus Hodarchaeota archaeon]